MPYPIYFCLNLLGTPEDRSNPRDSRAIRSSQCLHNISAIVPSSIVERRILARQTSLTLVPELWPSEPSEGTIAGAMIYFIVVDSIDIYVCQELF